MYSKDHLDFFIGKVAVEGKVEHKFDMKPQNENFEEYGKLCRERTNKSMMKNRQIQVKTGCYPCTPALSEFTKIVFFNFSGYNSISLYTFRLLIMIVACT